MPAFVDEIDGKRDFRFFSPTHWVRCVKWRRCWVCGDALGSYLAFVLGPMCTVSRSTSEPPCHLECARWSATYCPFLSRPRMVRREDELTDANRANSAGCPILRNPGCCAVWTARDYKIFYDDKGKPLIEVGEAVSVEWYAEGRVATRAEVLASIESGLPLLEEKAREDKDPAAAMAELHARVYAIEGLLPGA